MQINALVLDSLGQLMPNCSVEEAVGIGGSQVLELFGTGGACPCEILGSPFHFLSFVLSVYALGGKKTACLPFLSQVCLS